MTEQELDNRLRFLTTGDDGSVGSSENRLIDAWRGILSSYPGSAGSRTGLVVSVFDNAIGKWNPSDVIDFEDPSRTGINSFFHIWRNRDYLRTDSKLILEQHVARYCEPAYSLDPLEIIEKCRKRGVFVWVEPITEWGKSYEVCRRENGMTIRNVCAVDELQIHLKASAVAALELKENTVTL